MTEKEYNAEEFALSLGFSAESAKRFGAVNANATNLRNLAEARRAKGLMPDQISEAETEAKLKAEAEAVRAAEEARAAIEAALEAAKCPVCGKVHKAGSKVGAEHEAQMAEEAERIAQEKADADAQAADAEAESERLKTEAAGEEPTD